MQEIPKCFLNDFKNVPRTVMNQESRWKSLTTVCKFGTKLLKFIAKIFKFTNTCLFKRNNAKIF